MRTLLIRAFAEAPRGTQSRIADELGVRPTSVNKWSKGHNLPEPRYWRQLERLLGLTAGSLVLTSDEGTPDPFAAIRAELVAIRARLDALESPMRLTNERVALAASGADRLPKDRPKRQQVPRGAPSEQGEHLDE